MNRPILTYDSCGESGNIFWILGRVRRIMAEQHRQDAYTELWRRVQQAGSYAEALEILSEEVELIDTAN